MKSSLTTIVSVNATILLACGAVGGWLLFYLLPQLADLEHLEVNLVTLPRLHAGLPPAVKIIIFTAALGAGGGLMGWCIFGFRRLNSERIFHLHRLLVVQIAVGLLLAELVIRGAGMFRLWPGNMLTHLANPVCGETYHRLVATRKTNGAFVYDPELGWRRAPQPGNRDGLAWPPAIDDRPKAWFFGDSFMQGVLRGDQSPPAFFERRHRRRQALNFAVGGYGVDQIWLRYQRESARIPAGDPVVVGILTTDLDRAVLRFFGAFKPVYEKINGEYRLIQPPNPVRQKQILAAEPVRIGSYVGALLGAFAELVETGFDRSEALCDADRKREINSHLFRKIIATADARGHDLYWVVFVSWPEFYKVRSWRHEFIVDFLNSRGQKYLDTRALLGDAAAKGGSRPEAFYLAGDGHMTASGNRIVGEAMAAWID